MEERISAAVDRGAFNEALAILGERFKKPWRGVIDFNMEFDPRQDLLYEGAEQKPLLRLRALALIRGAKRRLPRLAALWTLSGAVHFAFKKFDLAVSDLDKALNLAPESSWTLLWRFRAGAYEAMTLKSMPLLEESVRLSERLLPRLAERFLLHAWRAELYTGFDLHEKALADLDEALRLKPDYGWAYSEKADIYTQQHLLEPALACCDRLIELYPGQGWAYALRSRAWGKCGRLNEALADLDHAVGLGSVLGAVYSWRGECRRHLGRFKAAVEDFNSAQALDPAYPLTYLWRGAAWLEMGRHKEAIGDLTRSIKLDPRNLLSFAWRGEAFLKRGQFKRGIGDLEKFYPSSPRGTWTGGQGAIWRDLDRLAATYASPLARACRGRFLLENPECAPERAFEDLDFAARALPRDSWCRAWRAQAHERLGRRSEALADLNECVRLKPDWSWAWAWRGKLRLTMGNRTGALADFNKSLRLNPISGEVYAWRAQAVKAEGSGESRRDFERALALGYKEKIMELAR